MGQYDTDTLMGTFGGKGMSMPRGKVPGYVKRHLRRLRRMLEDKRRRQERRKAKYSLREKEDEQ